MPRARPEAPEVTHPPNSLTAAASVLTAAKVPAGGIAAKNDAWQEDAWHYYDTVGELRFGASWLQNAMTRVRLVAGRRGASGSDPSVIQDPDEMDAETAPEDLPTETERIAYDLVAGLAGGADGRAELMGAAAVQLTIPGAGWAIGEALTPTAAEANRLASVDEVVETWRVLSLEEVQVRDGSAGRTFHVREGEATRDWRSLSAEALAVKFWRSHPRYHWKADSPTRAALPVLRELSLLTQHIDAAATSRLAGAGLLIMPTEVQFPVSEQNRDAEDPFMATLIDAMTTPIGDRSNASAVVPLPVRVPGDYVDKIRHLSFSTPLDAQAQSLREEAIKRLAAAVDLPAEVVLGLADSNHWTAWQISESALNIHVKPMAAAIAHALTVGYLRPALEALGRTDAADVVVWYDATDLQVRPDRSGDAQALYDRKAVGAVALRREAGFDEDDAPSDDELTKALLLDVVKAAPTLFPIIAPMLGLDVEIPEDAEALPAAPPANPTPPSPGEGAGEAAEGPPEQPAEAPTETPPAVAASAVAGTEALVAASDALVARALERAGSRLRNAARRAKVDLGDCPPESLHACGEVDATGLLPLDDLVDGAWDRVPVVAGRYGIDADALTATLDGYTRALLASGEDHDYETLAGVLGGR